MTIFSPQFRYSEEEQCGWAQGLLTIAGVAAVCAGISFVARLVTSQPFSHPQEHDDEHDTY